MKRLLQIVLISLSVMSCQTKDKFSIYTNLFTFPENLSEKDTLIIDANLSLCLCFGSERNYLIKDGGTMWIETFIEMECGGHISKKLDKVRYETSEKDSLTFENLFKELQNAPPIKDSKRTAMFRVIHMCDTVNYYTERTLSARTEILEKYSKLKRQFYPNEEFYNPELPPPPPSPLE